jgi:hypothetical protein
MGGPFEEPVTGSLGTKQPSQPEQNKPNETFKHYQSSSRQSSHIRWQSGSSQEVIKSCTPPAAVHKHNPGAHSLAMLLHWLSKLAHRSEGHNSSTAS